MENEEKKKVPEKFKKIIEEIEKMTVLELAELIKILEDKFGVKAQPQFVPFSFQPSVQTPSEVQKEQEKAFYTISLVQVGEKKIEVIKLVRDLTGKGLKESKDLVDAAQNSPQILKENVKKEEAEEIKKKFEAVGAKVELK